MGELKDWIPIIGIGVSGAVGLAGVMIGVWLKKGDRASERRKSEREKLELAYEILSKIVIHCDKQQTEMADYSFRRNETSGVINFSAPDDDMRRLSQVVKLYLPVLDDRLREFQNAIQNYQHRLLITYVGQAELPETIEVYKDNVLAPLKAVQQSAENMSAAISQRARDLL